MIAAATKHKDGYVRFRALVLLAGFGDPQVKTVMTSVMDDPNDRLRDVAYAWFERNPDPALAPVLLAKIDKETSEFVRPSLVRALAALGTDPGVQKVMLREATRGQTEADDQEESAPPHRPSRHEIGLLRICFHV